MSLLYSDVEEELRAAVRKPLTVHNGTPDGYDMALWRTLAVDIGCAGLPVPDERGGAGASWREVAVVAEELGRAVAAVPQLGGVLATAALLSCDSQALAGPVPAGFIGADDILAKVASGEHAAALVLPLSTPPGAGIPGSVAVDGATLTGTITSVADALVADVLVVPAAGALWTVDAGHATLAPVVSLDPTRPLCDVTLDSAPARLLAEGDAARPAWAAALTTGAAILASEQLGVAQWCLDTTVAYVKTRYQFARPVGSFQAVKHRLAQLWVEVTQARAVARYAAGCVADADPDAPIAAALAQAHCSQVAVRAAEECVQLHGGIGFTWEHPAHLYLKRAKSAAIALGTPARHRAALGELLDLLSSPGGSVAPAVP